MNKDIKIRLIKALRSGDFLQERYALKRREEDSGEDMYPVLGIICQMYKVSIGGYWKKQKTSNAYYFFDKSDSYSITGLPPRVREWAEISIDLQKKIKNWNDGNYFCQYSFVEIAEFLEREDSWPKQ